MKKLLIHIGTGKTGTTAIQQSLLAAQRENTLDPICYPDFLRGKLPFANPHRMLAHFYRPEEISLLFKSKGREDMLNAVMNDFKRELDTCFLQKDNIILSTEYLNVFNREEVVRFRADLERHALGDVAVVIYVRKPADFYLSLVNQTIRRSSTIHDPRTYKYEFRRAISIWSEIFDGKIIVRPFDRALLHQHCVVKDFVKLASDFFSHEIAGVEPRDTNESLSAEGCVVLQMYRDTLPGQSDNLHIRGTSPGLVRVLRQSLENLPQTKARLRKEVEEVITERHKDDLNWLRTRYGIGLLPDADSPARDWRPSRGEIRVEDIMESRDEIVQELLVYALRSALKRRRRKRPDAGMVVTDSHGRKSATKRASRKPNQ